MGQTGMGDLQLSGEIGTREDGARHSVLLCPRCGEETLHHGKVSVFDRPEDATVVTLTTVDAGVVAVHPRANGEGNPSSRRDGVTIDFDCESCGDGITLRLAQHKGSTLISWAMATEG